MPAVTQPRAMVRSQVAGGRRRRTANRGSPRPRPPTGRRSSMTMPWPMPNSAPSFRLVWKPKTSFPDPPDAALRPGMPSRWNIQRFDGQIGRATAGGKGEEDDPTIDGNCPHGAALEWDCGREKPMLGRKPPNRKDMPRRQQRKITAVNCENPSPPRSDFSFSCSDAHFTQCVA